MIKEPSTSIVDAEEIKDFIVKKYKPTKFVINFLTGNELDIYIATKEQRDGFEVITPFRFKEADIIDFAKQILKAKKINAKNLSLNITHVDGDSMEPMDYGTVEFSGVKFEWPEDEVAL